MPDITGIKFSSEGSVVYDLRDNSKLPLAGGTMTGPLDMGYHTLSGVPTPQTNGEAANKLYTDTLVQQRLFTADFIDDALNISIEDIASSRNLRVWRCHNDETVNMPTGVDLAIRKPCTIYNNDHMVIELFEISPNYGRIWFNKYGRTSSWSGWKSMMAYDEPAPYFTQGTWVGDLSYDNSMLIFPAHVYYRKWSNGVIDITINTKCELFNKSGTTHMIWSLQTLCGACGVSSITIDPKRTYARVYTPGDVTYPNTSQCGRTGLMVQKNDTNTFCLSRIYNDDMQYGGWGTEATGLYAVGMYYTMELHGVSYT